MARPRQPFFNGAFLAISQAAPGRTGRGPKQGLPGAKAPGLRFATCRVTWKRITHIKLPYKGLYIYIWILCPIKLVYRVLGYKKKSLEAFNAELLGIFPTHVWGGQPNAIKNYHLRMICTNHLWSFMVIWGDGWLSCTIYIQKMYIYICM